MLNAIVLGLLASGFATGAIGLLRAWPERRRAEVRRSRPLIVNPRSLIRQVIDLQSSAVSRVELGDVVRRFQFR
jgi:hypothetical protein